MSARRPNGLQRWFDIDLAIQLVGAEERRRPLLRAWRDRSRPRIWDRHLVVPTAMPAVIRHEVKALDEFYRETGAEQWSLIGIEGERMTAWAEALESFGIAPEERVLLQKETTSGPLPTGVVRLEEPTRDRQLFELRRSMTPDATGLDVLVQLMEVVRLGDAQGHRTVVLAAEEDGELVAYLMFTIVGEMAWMEDLETRADQRGRGHGRSLMRAAELEAYRCGARLTGFHASEGDWPWRWYQRLGWQLVGRTLRLRRTLPSRLTQPQRATLPVRRIPS